MTTIYETPSSAVCALPLLGLALCRIQAQLTGEPIELTPDTEALPENIEDLIAFCIGRVKDVHDVVQAASDELDKINDPETNPVAGLLNEIL